MSLQAKFAVLLGILGATVALSIGASIWAVVVIEREVSRPFADLTGVLVWLSDSKADLRAQAEALRSESPSEHSADAFESSLSRLDEGLREHMASDAAIARSGVTTSRVVRERIDATAAAGRAWFEGGDLAARADALERIDSLILLIERVEARLVTDSALAVGHGQGVRTRLAVVLALAVFATTLVASLGLLLLRRWVVRPVRALREAASRIAAGDLAHRIRVTGRDEIAMLSSEVNQMAATVAAVQEERVHRERLAATGEMVRRLAHNLRNPLAGIRGLAELTRDELPDDSELRESQDRIVTTVDRFESWLAGLVDVTSPLEVRPEPRDVEPWLRGVIEALRPRAEHEGVRLELHAARAPAEATFDQRHLEQALVAIVNNAIDAAPRGTSVRIQCRPASGEPGSWEVAVADSGPGVDPSLLERIFAAHFTTKTGGNGIGLAVARQIVGGHGGRIIVESPVGAVSTGDPGGEGPTTADAGPGAEFTIRLPLGGRSPESPGRGDDGGENSHH